MIINKKNQSNSMSQINTNEINSTKISHNLLSTFNRKRRHTFNVDLKIERVLSLPYANGRFFFKIRLLNGGHHTYTSSHRIEVNENKVEFNLNDHFQVKMTSRIDNFTLDHCFCRISIRKEGRAGRSYEKIGFCDLDLASVAGCGDELKACLLNGYQQTNTNPANAYLEIRIKLTVVDGDHIFRRPNDDEDDNRDHQRLIKSIQSDSQLSTSNKFISEHINDESSSINRNVMISDFHSSSLNPINRGHSRQASKSSVCSNYSNQSLNSISNGTSLSSQEKYSTKINSMATNSDEEMNHQGQKRFIQKRRSPFIDQFGDIQKRLQSTRVDVREVVNSVINENEKTIDDSNGYLCLLYNDDGTARVGSSSSFFVNNS